MYSASVSVGAEGSWYTRSEMRHAVFFAVALLVLLAASRCDYRLFVKGKFFGWPSAVLIFTAMMLCVLVFIPGAGHSVGGRYRWLRFGPDRFSIGLQPSEILKYSVVIFLAAQLTRRNVNEKSFLSFLCSLVLVASCTGLVITQDLGMGLIVCFAGLLTMYVAGVRWYYLAPLVPAGAAAACMFVMNSPGKLQRIMAVMDPWNEANPASYQAREAIKAACSGGLSGRGLGMGVRKLGFLPEDNTDFIFATFCEEWGVLGASLLVGLLALWLWKVRCISQNSTDCFGTVLAASLGIVIAFQALLHIAVNLVFLPPTGISLPFISAGGTSLVLTSFATGLAVSVSVKSNVPKQCSSLKTGYGEYSYG